MHAFDGLGFYPLGMLPSAAGSVQDDSIFITGTSAVTVANNVGMLLSITISATGDFIGSTGAYDDTLTISGTSALTAMAGLRFMLSVTVSGTGNVALIDGQQYNISVPIEGTSNLSLASGFLYSKSISLDVISDFTFIDLYIKQDSISLGSIATLDIGVLGNTTASLTVAGTSSCVVIDTAVMDRSVSIAATARFNVEQIYDILIVSAAVATISIQEKKIMGSSENPAAIGSFSASCQAQYNRTVVQTLPLAQTVVVKHPTGIIGQGFALSQTITVSKAKNVSVSHTLGLTQTPLGFRDVDNTLVFDQDVQFLISKRKTVNHSLNLTQTIGLNKVVNRSVSDTLVFNVPVETRLPMINGGTPFSYYASLIDFVLVPRKCLVILSVPSQTVVLPCPIWGDTQTYQGTLTIKRSMTGLTKTYVRQTQLQQLEYDFQLWTAKYLELRAFIMAHSHKQIRMDNWKGEGWIVNIMNNPVEFSAEGRFQPKGEQYSVKIQFEGVKIHG